MNQSGIMTPAMVKLAIFALGLVFVVPATAQIYTWTDAQGVVHYTDKQPKDQAVLPVQPGEGSRYKSKPIKPGFLARPAEKEDNPSSNRSTRRSDSSPAPTRSAYEKKVVRERLTEGRPPLNCQAAKRRIDSIDAQLKAGYSASQGNRLRSERKELNRQYAWDCMRR